MKPTNAPVFIYFVAFIAFIIFLPSIIVRGCSWGSGTEEKGQLGGPVIRVYIHGLNEIKKIPLEDYLVGVVAAEMPASFNEEALKAQAVAARTYTIRRLNLTQQIHPGADICTSYLHAQAWISREQMKKNWGTFGFLSNYRKIRQAVKETTGQVLVFQGNLIDPVYHATCGGLGTENSEDVWEKAYPYLRGVNCPERNTVRAKGEKVLSFKEIDDILGTNLVKRYRERSPNSIIRVLEKSNRGRAKSIRIDDKTFKGPQFRLALGLKSTYFRWSIVGNKIKFITTGNGHAVGLCQYGANALAQEGKSYKQILNHYYSHSSLKLYEDIKG